MINLATILDEYRDGQRGLPTYDELCQFVQQDDDLTVSPAPHEPTEAQ